MLRSDRQIRTQIYQFVDGGLFALGLWMAWLVRFHWNSWPILRWYPLNNITDFWPDYFWLFLVVMPMTPMILDWQGYYESSIFSPRRLVFWQVARACLISAVGLVLIVFMLHRNGARGVFVLFGFFSFGLMVLKGELLRWSYRSQLAQEQFRRHIILVGTPEDTKLLRDSLGSAQQEFAIVGEFDLNQSPIEKLVALFHEHSINTVIIEASHTVLGQVEAAIRACELEGIEAWLLADFFNTQISRTSLDNFFGRPVFVFHSGPEMPWARLVKQIIDIFGAIVLLIVFAIPMLIAAVAIKLSSKGPMLFHQKRSGLNGKPFVMYKFRTMVVNAEQMKQDLAARNEMSGPVFKVTNDPRVTPIGRILRKTSLDEFPQLYNVLRLEMSLVGPRPLPVDEVKRFNEVSHRRRLSVKPGLTCLWQISGRNEIKDFDEWVRLDLEYIDNWSLWLDIKILWRTIWVVLFGKGAS